MNRGDTPIPEFAVVENGYDVEQVKRFVTTRALPWRIQLEKAIDRIGELEREAGRFGSLAAELDEARELVALLQSQADIPEAPPKAGNEQLTAATKARALSLIEEAEKLRRAAELEAARIVEEGKTKAHELVSHAERALEAARSEASVMLAAGESEAENIRLAASHGIDQIQRELEARRGTIDEDLATARDELDAIKSESIELRGRAETSAGIVERAKVEADQVLEEARDNADRIVRTAQKETQLTRDQTMAAVKQRIEVEETQAQKRLEALELRYREVTKLLEEDERRLKIEIRRLEDQLENAN